MPAPIYTVENCRTAYQLNWSLAVFWKQTTVQSEEWFPALARITEQDGVRILHHKLTGATSQFLVSTRPERKVPDIARSVKGRLQYLVRQQLPKAFHRNYSVGSVGSARGEEIEQYVATQPDHHVMADRRVQDSVARYQVTGVADLTIPRVSGHAQFIYNLHVVLVNVGHLCDVREDVLSRRRKVILAASNKKGHLLSRAAILTDRVHLTLGCGLHESPAEVAIGYLNNLAYVEDMKPVFQHGYYVGTFGEYDLDAIRRRLA